MEDPAWHHHSHQSQDNAQPSLNQHSPLFPSENRAPDLSYPSPAPTIESPHFIPHHLSDQYSAHHQSSSTMTMSPSFTQVDSCIGPSRVLTRRQRAAYEGQRRSSLPSGFSRSEHDRVPRNHSVMFLTHPSMNSRPNTPTCGQELHQNQAHRERLSLSMDSVPLPMQPSNYHPMTPASSSSSSFSPYPLYPTHSRSNSSNSTNPRSASPALSNASALTSVSSSGSGSHPHTFGGYSQIHSEPVSSLHNGRPKQRKQRLVNAQRKQICLDHMSNEKLRQEDIAAKYGVERSTVSKILKGKQKWLSLPDNDDMRTAKHRPSKFPDIEEELVKWLEECKAKNASGHLSDASIRAKAKEVAKALDITEEKFKASSGWVENFKQRHGIRGGNWHGDGRNAQMGRAQGAGALTNTGAVLSPLHSNFDLHSENFDATSPAANMNRHLGVEGSPGPEEQIQQCQGDSAMESLALQPAWPEHNDDVPRSTHSNPSQIHESMPQGGLIHSAPSSALGTLSSHPQLSENDRRIGLPYPSPGYEDSLSLYQPLARIPNNHIPTLADAEEAINTLITFLDSDGQSIIQHSERQVLNTIKCALFQAASGVPFDRSQH